MWGAVPPRTGTPTQGTEAAASVAVAQQATQIIEQQPQQENAPVHAPMADAGLADMVADHVVSAGLDSVLPGAGALFDLMSMAEPGPAGPAPATRQQVQQVEHEDEDEAGQ